MLTSYYNDVSSWSPWSALQNMLYRLRLLDVLAGMQIGLETSEASFDETASCRIEVHLVGKDRNRAMQLSPTKSCEVIS
jgi:hypothetical protein